MLFPTHWLEERDPPLPKLGDYLELVEEQIGRLGSILGFRKRGGDKAPPQRRAKV